VLRTLYSWELGPDSSSLQAVQQDPEWESLPEIDFIQGVAGQTFNLQNYVTWNGNSPGDWVFSVTQGYSLETGVSLSSNGTLSYDGSSPVASATVEFDLNTTAQADWIARSTASGVFGKENFSGFANVTAWWDAWNNGTMGQGGWFINGGGTKNPHTNPNFSQMVGLQADAGHQRTGNSLRLWMGEYNYQQAGTLDYQIVNQYLNFNVNSAPSAAFLTTFYIQLTIWVDAYVDYYWDIPGGGSLGLKFMRLDDQRLTNDGEIVLQDQQSAGFVTLYRRNDVTGTDLDTITNGGGDGTPYNSTGFNILCVRQMATPANQYNLQHQPAIDNGGVLTDEASYHRRYGPFNYGMTNGTSQSSLLHTQPNTPDPDALIGGIGWNRAGLTTVEIYVNLGLDQLKMWASHTGNAPKKLVDRRVCLLGSRNMPDGVGWNTVVLTPLVYSADYASNPGYPHSYVDYSEIIVSTNPINFPGGFSLP